MSRQDRERWERKHETPGTEAAAPSVAALPRARVGEVVLDLACGQGRNTVALTELGYRVVAADIAQAALRHLGERLRERAPAVLRVQADLDAWPFAYRAFDGVVQCAFLDRRLFDAIKASVRPGGFVLIDTFLRGDKPNESGPKNEEFLLKPGELARVFVDWHILDAFEGGDATLRARILARKP